MSLPDSVRALGILALLGALLWHVIATWRHVPEGRRIRIVYRRPRKSNVVPFRRVS